MFLIILHLFLASAVCLVYGALHAVGYFVGIHYHFAVNISGGATRSLSQRPVVAQKAFLVGIKNRDETHLRKVKTLTEKIDTNQYIVRHPVSDPRESVFFQEYPHHYVYTRCLHPT